MPANEGEGIVVPARSPQLPNQRDPLVLVTLPVFNEAFRIETCVDSVTSALREANVRFLLAIAEDGSDDGTKSLINDIARRRPEIIVQSLEGRRGRGYALRVLWSGVEADVYAFSDVDLAAGTESLLRGLDVIDAGADVVIGSRYVDGASVVRPPLRSLASRSYNRLIRLLLGGSVMDHQCGMKLFTRSAISKLLSATNEDTWFWDTEVVVLAQRMGMLVKEIPVNWVERKVGRTEISRLLNDIYVHGTGLLKLKADLSNQDGSGWRHPRKESDSARVEPRLPDIPARRF